MDQHEKKKGRAARTRDKVRSGRGRNKHGRFTKPAHVPDVDFSKPELWVYYLGDFSPGMKQATRSAEWYGGGCCTLGGFHDESYFCKSWLQAIAAAQRLRSEPNVGWVKVTVGDLDSSDHRSIVFIGPAITAEAKRSVIRTAVEQNTNVVLPHRRKNDVFGEPKGDRNMAKAKKGSKKGRHPGKGVHKVSAKAVRRGKALWAALSPTEKKTRLAKLKRGRAWYSSLSAAARARYKTMSPAEREAFKARSMGKKHTSKATAAPKKGRAKGKKGRKKATGGKAKAKKSHARGHHGRASSVLKRQFSLAQLQQDPWLAVGLMEQAKKEAREAAEREAQAQAAVAARKRAAEEAQKAAKVARLVQSMEAQAEAQRRYAELQAAAEREVAARRAAAEAAGKAAASQAQAQAAKA